MFFLKVNVVSAKHDILEQEEENQSIKRKI